jgi:hypothetical protein
MSSSYEDNDVLDTQSRQRKRRKTAELSTESVLPLDRTGPPSSALKRTVKRPSFLSPTKASLARHNPHLLPRPSSSRLNQDASFIQNSVEDQMQKGGIIESEPETTRFLNAAEDNSQTGKSSNNPVTNLAKLNLTEDIETVNLEQNFEPDTYEPDELGSYGEVGVRSSSPTKIPPRRSKKLAAELRKHLPSQSRLNRIRPVQENPVTAHNSQQSEAVHAHKLSSERKLPSHLRNNSIVSPETGAKVKEEKDLRQKRAAILSHLQEYDNGIRLLESPYNNLADEEIDQLL